MPATATRPDAAVDPATEGTAVLAGTRAGNADSRVLGVLLVVFGTGWILRQADVLDISWPSILATVLVALGVGMVVTARSAGGGGLVVVGLVLTVVLASATAVDVKLLRRGAGERSYVPTTAADLDDPFQLGVGSMTVDLRDVDPTDLRGEDVRVQVGMGELIVLLPPESEVPVRIVAEARAGEIDLFSSATDEGGTNVRRAYADPARAGVEPLEVDLDVGLGSIQVIRRPAA